MRCPRCDTECLTEARFCHACGTPLVGRAPTDTTGVSKPADSLADAVRRLMPTSYVEKLLASKGKIEGERRVVTILFSDVKGSTAMAENLDPEDVLEIMNGAFEVLIEPITRYEGTLARLMGDAILAFFGAPIAHEDDPERACRAALDIIDGARTFAKRLERERGIAGFNVRVGINTGLVVVAEVGADLRVEYTAMGDAVNLAARMESVAEPGTVLITEDTHRLVQDRFETESLGAVTVKGKTEPVNVFRLSRVKNRSATERFTDGLHSPLVGRDDEFHRMIKAIDDLRSGKGSCIVIVGEPGLGKSRLIAEVRQSPSAQTAKWAEGRGLAYMQGTSYWMARNIACTLMGVSVDAQSTALRDALLQHLGALSSQHETLNSIHPYLARLLNIPLDDSVEQNLCRLDAEALQEQIVRAFRDFIKLQAQRHPLIVVWDDLQWADPSSLNLLESLLSLSDEAPTVFLLAYRLADGIVRRFHERLVASSSSHSIVIQLQPLTSADSRLLLDNLVSNRKLPEETRRQILEKTEGNAFFIEEVLRSFMDEDESEMTFHVPTMLQSAIMARIDRLAPGDKSVLQTASVVGRVLQRSILSRVLDCSIENSGLDRTLAELQRREFILPNRVDASNWDTDTFVFKHSLTHDVVYGSLLLSHRRKLHGQIGETIESLFPDRLNDLASTLALHFERGSVGTKAFHYFLMSADRAKQLFANDEAISAYSKALKLAEECDVDLLAVAHAYESIGDVYSLTAKYAAALEQYEQALELLEESSQRSTILRKCGQVCERWGKYDKGIEFFESGLKALEGCPDPIQTARIFTGLGMIHYRQGRLDIAIQLHTRTLETMRQLNDAWGIAEACNNLGIAYSKVGDQERALQFHRQCLATWEQLGQTCGIASSHNNIGRVYQRLSDWNHATEHFQRSVELSEQIGDRHGLARTLDNLSKVLSSQGKKDEARMYTEKAMAILEKIGVESSENVPEIWLQSGVW